MSYEFEKEPYRHDDMPDRYRISCPPTHSPEKRARLLKNNQTVAGTEPVKPDNGGLRYNDGKPRYDLIPPEFMEALAAHFAYGANKYADRNWERGMSWSKCFASLMRHAWAWMRGEDTDAESGSHHMVAVAWNALALYVYATRKIGIDDRKGKP